MPLPDYSKFKADLKRKSQNGKLEANLGNLPLADMDEEANRRRDSGDRCYDMGFDLELDHQKASDQPRMDSSRLEDSMASLSDPFYDEEESVTENYDESLHESSLSIRSSRIRRRTRSGGSISRSASDIHRPHFPDNPTRRSMNKSMTDLDTRRLDRSSGSLDLSHKSTGKLGDFLDKSKQRERKKTALLPGSTTEDLCSEMNEVVSMLSAKRSGTNRRADHSGLRASSKGPPLKRAETHSGLPQNPNRRLRDGSDRRGSKSPSASARRTPRRTSSHDGGGGIRRTQSDDENRPGGSRRGTLQKSRSADGSKRQLPPRNVSGDKHTSSSFVTGSRIRRITPGGGRDLGASLSNLSKDAPLRQKHRELSPTRSVSPKSGSRRVHKKVNEGEVPPLLFS